MKIHSFDIFDTCLIRACGRPSVIFDLMAKTILGTHAETAALIDFALIRREGEKKARAKLMKSDCEEVSIYDIYDQCDFSPFTDMPKESIISVELVTEDENISPVYHVQKAIEKIHLQGENVLFISDMYLPEEFVLSLLVKHHLWNAGDCLYLSSSIKKTKRTGNLYRYIHHKLKLKYNQWEHCGDNIVSDIKIPRQLGINVIHVDTSYSYYERQMKSLSFSNFDNNVEILTGISRAVRLMNMKSARVSFAADFIAPLYVPFVHWILSDAKRRGIHRVFFLSRDGYILYFIAQCFKDLFPEIETRYLYVSRNSLYLPGLSDISIESIKNMFWNIDSVSVEAILNRLQMDGFNYNIQKLKDKSADIVIRDFFSNPDFVSSLKLKKEEQERLCMLYFKEQRLTDGQSAIVDLAGTRKCHVAINNILKKMKCPPVYGYYMEVTPERIKGNGYTALYYIDRYEEQRHLNPLIPQDLFEQYYSISDHDRTVSYKIVDDKVQPVFDKAKTTQINREIFDVNKEVCIHFAMFYRNIVTSSRPDYLCNLALKVYQDFYKSPQKFYLTAIEGVRFSDSKVNSEVFLKKEPILRIISRRKGTQWFYAKFIYNIFFSDFFTKIFRARNLIHSI